MYVNFRMNGPKVTAQNDLQKVWSPLTYIKSRADFFPSPVKLSFWTYKVVFRQQRYTSTRLLLRKTEVRINRRLLSEMFVSLNELYDELDLPHCGIGDDIGWNIDEGQVDQPLLGVQTCPSYPYGPSCLEVLGSQAFLDLRSGLCLPLYHFHPGEQSRFGGNVAGSAARAV